MTAGTMLFLIMAVCLAPSCLAQENVVVYKEIPDNRGKEFVIGFMQQFNRHTDGAVRLFFTSDYHTSVEVTTPATFYQGRFDLKPRELKSIDLSNSLRMDNSGIENKGILIKADREIVVYGLNIKRHSTDAFLALPTDIQSTKYIIPSFTPSHNSLIGIIGIHDGTIVFITFRFANKRQVWKYKGREYRHKDTLTFKLDRLKTFQVACPTDLTGTRIISSKPISVFSGNECAFVPKEKAYCDHLVEHIPPTNTWGHRFVTAPFRERSGGDYFRVLAANDSTKVTVNQGRPVYLDEGRYIQLDVPSNKYQYIHCSKACLVMQYSKGSSVDNTATDPFMIMIPPIEQYTAQYTLSTPDQSAKYFESFLNIMLETKDIDGLRLDGKSLRGEKWVPVWGTSHSAARVNVSHGVHRVMHDSPIVPFAVFLYGFQTYDSYGYPGGLRLADLTLECVPGAPGDGVDNDCDRRIDEELKNFIDDDNDGRIDEDLVTEPPRIDLIAKSLRLKGCPAEVKKHLSEPTVTTAPLCNARGQFKMTSSDEVVERNCVQHIIRTWYVRDGCGNLANTSQDIIIKRPNINVQFPADVRGKCHLANDLSVTGKPVISSTCAEDVISVRYQDTPDLQKCVKAGTPVDRVWSIKASCGIATKHTQKLLPDVTPPKLRFVGKPVHNVKRDFKISWQSNEDATFECGLGVSGKLEDCGSGVHGTWLKRNVPNGKNIFRVRGTDAAGNTGAFIFRPFNVDNVGPRLRFVPPLKHLVQKEIAIGWRSPEVARFKCGLDHQRMENCGSGKNGKETYNNLRDDIYNFYVSAIDDVGNEGRMITHRFKVDSIPPRIRFVSGTPKSNTDIKIPIISNEQATFYCALDQQDNYQKCGEGQEAVFKADKVSDGPHTLYVTAEDPAGNKAGPIFMPWELDTTAPNIAFHDGLPTKFRRIPKITWSSSEYAKFECGLDGSDLIPCGRGDDGDWTQLVNDGPHVLKVRGIDTNGNVGPISSFSFDVDSKPPTVKLEPPLPKTSTTKTWPFRWQSDEMASYKCAIDSTATWVPCGSGNDGEWTTPPLSDGRHTFYLKATDEIGNEGHPIRRMWSIDTKAPRLRFTSQLPGREKRERQRFTWSSSETYTTNLCSIDSGSFTKCGTGPTGTWLSDKLSDGSHTFRVKGRDRHGNEGPMLEHTWTIDTHPPTVTMKDVPSVLTEPNVKLEWDASEPSTFICTLDGRDVLCGAGVNDSVQLNDLPEGEHTFRVQAQDMVGNKGPKTTVTFTTDTLAPLIRFDRRSPRRPEPKMLVSWTSSENGKFQCSLDDKKKYEDCGNGKKGFFEKDDLPDGKHRLYVRGTDKVGNVGKPSVFTVTTDNTPPVVKFTDKEKPLSRDPTETFTWDSSEQAEFECQVDNEREVKCGKGTTGSFTTPRYTNGNHIFRLTPVDSVGNRGKTIERLWKVDTTPPLVRYVDQPPRESDNKASFKWDSSEPATFECRLDNGDVVTCGDGTNGERNLTSLPKGDRTFWVRGTDRAGNVGKFVRHDWTVDKSAPKIRFTGDLPSFSKKSLTLNYISDEDSVFECALDDINNFQTCGTGTEGSWTNNQLPEGNRRFYVRARDQLNNVGKPISHSWVVDSTPPVAQVNPIAKETNSPKTTLSWSANEDSLFYCAIGDVGNTIQCGEGTSGSWTTPYLRPGPQKFWLIAEDLTGNKAEPIDVGWIVDYTAPKVEFSPDSTSKTKEEPKVSWTSDEESTFQCSVEGVTDFQFCGTGTEGSWTGQNIPDGQHNFLVKAVDKLGNHEKPSVFPFEKDSTPPTGFTILVPKKLTKDPTADFKWKTSEDATFDCYINNQSDPTDCGYGVDGQYTSKPLPDGKHKFKVLATDDIGNQAPVVNHKWVVDTKGPEVKFDPDQPRSTLNSPKFSWSSDEPASFECSLNDKWSWRDCSHHFRDKGIHTHFSKTGSWQSEQLSEGQHTLFVVGTDQLGNRGEPTGHTFTVDNQAPTITLTSLPERNSSRPTFKWKATEPVRYQCSLNDNQYTDCGSGSDGEWTGNNIPDGKHVFKVQGIDENGNTGRHTHTWNIDSKPPSIIKVTPTNVYYERAIFKFESDETSYFTCYVKGMKNSKPTNCGYGKDGEFATTVPSDGTYTFEVTPTDLSGNVGKPGTHTWEADLTPPDVKVLPDSSVYSSQNPTFRFTSTEETTFQCAVDDTRKYVNCGSGLSGTFTARNVPNGRHAFFVQGTDKNGNRGKHVKYLFKVDTDGPQIYLTKSVPSKTNDKKVDFRWTSNEPAKFECVVDGKTSDCGSGKDGQFTTDELPDGQHTFTLNIEDDFGNKGRPVTVNWETDATAPRITFPDDTPSHTNNIPRLTWGSTETATFECMLDDTKIPFYCGQGKSGEWGDVMRDGPHTLHVRGKDSVNDGPWTQHRFTVDTKPPRINLDPSTPKITKSEPKFTWGSSEPAKYQCAIDNGELVDCGEGTKGSWTAPDLKDGPHVFTVFGEDKVGNRRSKKFDFTVDNSYPVISFFDITPVTGRISQIPWRSSEDASFECSLNDGPYKKCGRGLRRNGNWVGRDLPHGDHKLSVKGRDRNGNVGQPSSANWRVDSEGPVLQFQPPLPKTTKRNMEFAWNSSEQADFECRLKNMEQGIVLGGGSCGSGENGKMSVNGRRTGKYRFSIRGYDKLGNVGEWIDHDFYVDRTGPKLTFPSELPRVTNGKPKFEWTSSDKAKFECGIDNTFNAQDCGDGINGKWTGDSIPDGPHVFWVRGVDDVGNKGNIIEHRFTVDGTAPVVSFSQLPDQRSQTPRITWTSGEVADFECSLDGGKYENCGSGRYGLWTGSNVPDGKHEFSVRARDKNGNVGQPNSHSWDIDSNGPELTFTPNLPKLVKGKINVTWDSSEPATFECRLVNSNSGVEMGTGRCGNGTNGKLPINRDTGLYKFSVRGYDNLGNPGDWIHHEFNVDRSGPKVSFPSDLPRVTDQNPSFNWKSSNQAKFQCGIDNTFNAEECGEGVDGKWTGKDIPDGTHIFWVRGVDKDGNPGNTIQHQFVVDSRAPVIQFSQLPDKRTSSPRFAWTSGEYADFECSLDGGNYENCGSGRYGLWTGSNIPDGKHEFSVRGRDKNGNVGQPMKHTWNIDSDGPSLQFTSPLPKQVKGQIPFTWSSTVPAVFDCSLKNTDSGAELARGTCGSGITGEKSISTDTGNYKFSVRARDNFGNFGEWIHHDFNVDRNGPKITFPADLPRTTNEKPLFNWTSSEFATFRCGIDSDSNAMDCGDGTDGSWTGDNIPDGPHVFWVQGVDKLGNKGNFIQHPFTVDSTAPVVQFSRLPDKRTSTPSISWTSGEQADFECSLDGGDYKQCGSGLFGTWKGPNLPDGQHEFSVRAKDKHGNIGKPIKHSWKTDTNVPVLQFTSPLPSEVKGSIDFTWRSSEPVTFDCRVTNNDNGAELAKGSCGSGVDGSISINRETGNYKFSVRGYDTYGNTGKWIEHDFKVDRSGPTVTMDPNLPQTTSRNPSFTWTSSEDAKFKCGIGSTDNLVDCGQGRDGKWTAPDLPSGLHTFLVYGVDDVGNKGNFAQHTFTVDKTPPVVQFPSHLPTTTKSNPYVTWSSSEPADFECALDDPSKTIRCGEGTTGKWNGINVPDGPHKFMVRGRDPFNNIGDWQTYDFVTDAKPPNVQLNPTPEVSNTPRIVLDWSADEEAIYTCSIDDKPEVNCGYGKSSQWITPNLPDGEHTFSLNYKDRYGNTGPTIKRKFLVDTKPPVLAFKLGLPTTSGKNPTFKWTSDEQAKFECFLNDFNNVFDCGNGTSGTWTANDLADKRHVLGVRGIDKNGNVGDYITHGWVVDDSAPRLQFYGELPLRARTMPTIRWKSNEDAKFECSIDGSEFRACGGGFDGSWTETETSHGSHTFRVRGRDGKNNVGEPISHDIIIDNKGPRLKLLPPLVTRSKEPTMSFTFTADEPSKFFCSVDSIRNKKPCGEGTNGRFTTEPLSNGRHVFYLQGKDELDNGNRIIHRWIVDKTRPELEFIPGQPRISSSDVTIQWKSVTPNKAVTFLCALDDRRLLKPCGQGTTGSWSGENIPDGTHTFYVQGKDSYGTLGDIIKHKWIVDTKLPQVQLINSPPKESNRKTGTFVWKSDENAKYQCSVDVVESAVDCGQGLRGNWISPDLSDGEHTFYLFSVDKNGNNGDPVKHTWSIDSTPPRITMDPANPSITGKDATIKWKTNEEARFLCAIDSIFNPVECGSGKNGEFKMEDLFNGDRTIFVKAIDKLGNVAPWQPHSLFVDSLPPSIMFTSNPPKKTNGTAVFHWRTSKDSTFKCGTEPGFLEDCGAGLTSNWTGKDLKKGPKEFIVKATDPFGNTATIKHKWLVDNDPPVLSFKGRHRKTSGKRMKIRWKSNENAKFYCAHENIDEMEYCGEGIKGSWIEDDLPEGKHRFWITGYDDVGNKGNVLEHEWVVDTRGPRIYFKKPVPKKTGATAVFTLGTDEYTNFYCALDDPRRFRFCGNHNVTHVIKEYGLKHDDRHTLYVKGRDRIGNEGDIISTSWIVDLVAPQLVSVGPLPRLTNANPVFTWEVNEIASFECTIDDVSQSCGNGTKGEFRGKDIPKGPHTLKIKVRDPQGNAKSLINHTFVVGIPDNRGREFVLGMMQQYNRKRGGNVILFITSDNYTIVNIHIPLLLFHRTVPVKAGQLRRVELPISVRMSGSRVERKGILVTADHEIVVYGLNIMPHSTDAFLALPTDIQSTEYYAVSYTVSQHSLIGIVGIEDDTRVYITLKIAGDVPLIYNGRIKRSGETIVVTLDRLNTLQLTHTADLTGTHIRSDKVISVYSGNECANVPKEKGYCDHLVEMITPTSTWGRRFVTAPFLGRKSGDFFRVVASRDNTMVIFHPDNRYFIDAGEFVEMDIPSDEYVFITASEPCLLMQYSKGANTDNTKTDPFMIMIPPIEQYGSNYILSTPDDQREYFNSVINIIVLTQHYRGVMIDGNPAFLQSTFKSIKGTPYSAAAVRVSIGVHRVDHISPIVTFGAFMYGYAWRDSYGYPGGLRVADITGNCTGVDTPADGMDNDCDRLIDEELKNGIDDDGDGRIDEDLATFPPAIELEQTYYEYQSCALKVDALVPRPKAIGSYECQLKGELRLTFEDEIEELNCARLINRTWRAADGCGNIVYLTQIIKITKPELIISYPTDVPNGCNGPVDLKDTGEPDVTSTCIREQVILAYRDSISVNECQNDGALLFRYFTITELCGRKYTGVQRIYPGAA